MLIIKQAAASAGSEAGADCQGAPAMTAPVPSGHLSPVESQPVARSFRKQCSLARRSQGSMCLGDSMCFSATEASASLPPATTLATIEATLSPKVSPSCPGFLAPRVPITLTDCAKAAAGIPMEATHFAFAYPLDCMSGQFESAVRQVHSPLEPATAGARHRWSPPPLEPPTARAVHR